MSTRQPSVAVGAVGNGNSSAIDQPSPASAGNKKPGSGRPKGGSRASSKNHGHPPSEEGMPATSQRKKTPANHKDTKSRPLTQHRSHKDGSRSGGGGGGSQHSSRGKGELGQHHSNHHSNRHRGPVDSHRAGGGGSASSGADGFPAGSSTGSMAEAGILSSNRFEKLEIDPEHEASSNMGSSTSGESINKSSSSSSTSPSSSLICSGSRGTEEKKPAKERNRSGRGSFRGRGSASKFQPDSNEMGDSVKSSGGSWKEDRNVLRGEDGQKKKSPKQIRFDLPSDGRCAPRVKEQEQDGEQCGNGQGLVALPAVGAVPSPTTWDQDGGVDSSGDGSPPSEAASVDARKNNRTIYTRVFLLSLRKSVHSLPPPPGLDAFDLLSRPQLLFATEHPFKKDSISSAEDSKPAKHPTALTLIKEHDKHFVGKVSLSPQRGSFQRGCSWKDRVSNSDVSQNSSESSLKTPPPKFSCGDGQSDSSQLKYEGQKSQAGGRPSGPRVINHVPLRDQEQKLSGKKSWRGTYKDFVEPEPEWMEFGPTDRFDVIELKGFEEHEAKKDDNGSPTEELASQADGPDSPVETKVSPVLEQSTGSNPQAAEVPSQKQEDNEFILDGFDFSTGVSICQALDLDEDEAGSTTTEKSSLLLSNKGVTDPSELGSVLLKALGMSKETAGSMESNAAPPQLMTSTGINSTVVSAAPPANALTLDEIHAREDIHPSPTQTTKDTASVGEGMEAFNKLLAVLESKQPKPSQMEKYSPPSQNYSDPGHILQQRVQVPRPGPAKQVSPSFGYPLDKELLNIEEDISGTNLGFPEPNLRRLEQLERMLETMDRMDPTTARLYDYNVGAVPHTSLPPPPPPPPHRVHQMDQRVPVHPSQMDREGRGWMYPQEQRGRNHPTPQQLAAARQHQMLTNARGNANNWAVEMEHRRLMELRQMQLAKEKELYGGVGATPTGGMLPQSYKPQQHPSKPNISLLPTAVMRHMHTNKPGNDLPKTTSISNRLDQDLTNKASQTHSTLNSLLSHTQEFSGPPNDYGMHSRRHHHGMPAGMRMAPAAHSAPKPSDLPPSGSVYPHYNLPHGMPVHNPYMY